MFVETANTARLCSEILRTNSQPITKK